MKNTSVYPIQYIEPAVLKEGSLIQLRPIHQVDSIQFPMVKEYYSKESLYQRFLGLLTINEALIKKFTELDYNREMAIVAEVKDDKGQKQIIGVGRIAPNTITSAEFAIIIQDAWQGKGLGRILTQYIIEIARDLGYTQIEASLFSNNKVMSHLLTEHGFVQESVSQGITTRVLHLY